jgi:DNA-binding CsgD family transcriptional regulator
VGSAPDYVRKKYGPLLAKNLETALAHCIAQEFPRLGGPRIQRLCAQMLLEVVSQHLQPREHLRHGQVLWLGISRECRPRRHQRIVDCQLVPIVLDLTTQGDIEARLNRDSPSKRLAVKAVRLCEQAFKQGALLSNCDLAELLNTHDAQIAHLLVEHERKTGRLVPRRATLHDVGTGLTHKRIICWKRFAEGKEPDQIARETYHSLEAVDRYLGQYDRVRHCRLQGLSTAETAHVLDCTVRLVEEYLAIDRELEKRNA